MAGMDAVNTSSGRRPRPGIALLLTLAALTGGCGGGTPALAPAAVRTTPLPYPDRAGPPVHAGADARNGRDPAQIRVRDDVVVLAAYLLAVALFGTFLVTADGTFYYDLTRRFVQPDTRCGPHQVFGELTRNEWMIWGYRHLDHHLRQFGL